MQKIMISHSVINPKLFSVMQNNSLFDSNLEADYKLFINTYAKRRQRNIADSLNYVLAQLNGMTGEIEFNEYDLFVKPIEPIAIEPTTFSADKATEEVLEHFKNCGTSKEGITILESCEFKFNSDDEIIDTFFKDSFANVTETQGRIITMLQNGESYDAIVKALDLKPIEVTQQILKLQSLGYLEGGEPTSKGLKETATRESISVVYSYEKRPDAPDLVKGGKSRPFCETLVQMDKVYSRSEIDSISNAIGRDVWYYRGGWYHNPDTNRNTPSCRHFWKQNVIIK